MSYNKEWRPNSIPLGAVLVSGSAFFVNGGAGVYLSMAGNADDASSLPFMDADAKSNITSDLTI